MIDPEISHPFHSKIPAEQSNCDNTVITDGRQTDSNEREIIIKSMIYHYKQLQQCLVIDRKLYTGHEHMRPHFGQ